VLPLLSKVTYKNKGKCVVSWVSKGRYAGLTCSDIPHRFTLSIVVRHWTQHIDLLPGYTLTYQSKPAKLVLNSYTCQIRSLCGIRPQYQDCSRPRSSLPCHTEDPQPALSIFPNVTICASLTSVGGKRDCSSFLSRHWTPPHQGSTVVGKHLHHTTIPDCRRRLDPDTSAGTPWCTVCRKRVVNTNGRAILLRTWRK